MLDHHVRDIIHHVNVMFLAVIFIAGPIWYVCEWIREPAHVCPTVSTQADEE